MWRTRFSLVGSAVLFSRISLTACTFYRDIPILPQLAALLPDCGDSAFVFGEDAPLSHMQMVNTWIRISKRIDLHGATLHTLRHSFLTMASNIGIEPKTIQALAGHADISITMNRYVHAQMEPIKRAGATLGQKINNLGTRQERAWNIFSIFDTLIHHCIIKTQKEEPLKPSDFNGSRVGSPGRARTYNNSVNSPVSGHCIFINV